MNNSEVHQTNLNSRDDGIASRHEQDHLHQSITSPTTTSTPLYDMFSKHIEQFIDAYQKQQYNPTVVGSIEWRNLANMFSFQMLMIGLILIFSSFTIGVPVWIFFLGMIGVGCGFYSMVTKDPLGMFIYSLLNFIGFVFCLRYLSYGYAATGMCFILLLLNQIKSIGFVIEFGRAKLGKRQVFETHSDV